MNLMKIVPLSIRGWLFKRKMYRGIPKNSLNYKVRKAREYMGLTHLDLAKIIGETEENVKLFEYGLSGIVYEDNTFSPFVDSTAGR